MKIHLKEGTNLPLSAFLTNDKYAAFPISGKRVNQKPTWFWFLVGALTASMLCGFLFFFLFPRSVSVQSDSPDISEVTVVEFRKGYQLVLNFFNEINVSNSNYYSVIVSNASAIVLSRFSPWQTDLIGEGSNNYNDGLSIPLRSNGNTLLLNNTVTLKGDAILEYCTNFVSNFTSMYFLMEFDTIVSFEYLGHHEQQTISTVQQVCCVPSGNCTASL